MNQQRHDPTPAEIAQRCAEIQATWTPDERHKRLRVDQRPMFRAADGSRQAISVDDYEQHHIGQAPRC